jgi:hypothetical protein
LKEIFVRLDGDIAQNFAKIKEVLGLKNDVEVCRYLISTFYKEKIQKEA